MHDTGCLGLVHWDDPEGWNGAALVAQVVREQVHGHGRHGHVHLAARRAAPRQLAVQAAVRLLVAAQVRRRGIRFAALAARVPAS